MSIMMRKAREICVLLEIQTRLSTIARECSNALPRFFRTFFFGVRSCYDGAIEKRRGLHYPNAQAEVARQLEEFMSKS